MNPRLSDLLLRSQSDERLVSLARAGHDRAFATIVQRYRPELLALARRLTSDGRAEDLLQQAFLSAFAALKSDAEVQHLRGWLYQIVRNAATKARPQADLVLDQVDIAGEPLEDTVLRRARALAAMSELARLPERQRGALVATALGDQAHADVALSMGISEQAVRQLVHRARAKLRGAVTAVTPWPLASWLATAPNAATGPEVAVSAGAVSSTGVAVKVGALLAASGALATGVAVGPVGQAHHGGVGPSAVPHLQHATARPDAPSPRTGSVEAAPAPQVRRKARETGSSRGARTRGPAASPAARRRVRFTAITTANAGGADLEDLIGRHSGANSPEGAGSAGHDSQSGSGSTAPAGSGSDGSPSGGGSDGSRSSGGTGTGTGDGASSGAGESGEDVMTGPADTPSQNDGGEGATPVASSASASGSSGGRGDSDGDSDSSRSDGGEGGHSGSGSDDGLSDTSTEGK